MSNRSRHVEKPAAPRSACVEPLEGRRLMSATLATAATTPAVQTVTVTPVAQPTVARPSPSGFYGWELVDW